MCTFTPVVTSGMSISTRLFACILLIQNGFGLIDDVGKYGADGFFNQFATFNMELT
jgi:hypothetical protein